MNGMIIVTLAALSQTDCDVDKLKSYYGNWETTQVKLRGADYPFVHTDNQSDRDLTSLITAEIKKAEWDKEEQTCKISFLPRSN